MHRLNKHLFLIGSLLGMRLTVSAVIGTSDTFNSDTSRRWVSVGETVTSIEYDPVSEGDYDDGDPTTNLAYTVGMTLTGDGVKDDGGLELNSQNAIPGDEAMGLTIAGTMEDGEKLTFSGSVYNDQSSYCRYKAQLWNLTDNSLLAESALTLVRGDTHSAYVPVDFSVAYTTGASDEGDTLQIRFLEDHDNTARHIFVDNFSLTSSIVPPAPATATYPWGGKFWFSFYSTLDADTEYALANGATGMGPYYGSVSNQQYYYDWADEHGVNISYKVRPACMADFTTSEVHDPDFVWPSDATITADAIAAVMAARDNTNIVMWDLHPEEVLYYDAQEVHYLELVSAVVHAYDPYNRPLMMYEQNNRTVAALSVTLPYQDICAKGTYVQAVNSGEFKNNRIWARWSMEQELGAIAATNTNAVPWVMLWMAADAAEGEEHLIEDWCRHDAYMGLIMGGKGISIWSGWRPRAGFENDFQAYFDGYLSVAADLNLGRNFAPVFLYGAAVTGVTHNVTAGPTALELVYPADVTNSYPPVTYTLLQYLDQQYLFAVNSATQAVTLTFSGVPDAPRTDLFQGVETPASGGSFSVAFDPYEVVAFRFDGYETWRDSRFTQQQIDDGLGDPDADPDGDDRTNRDEYNAETEPLDGGDFFASSLAFSNHWKTVSFETSSNRFYRVDVSTNLVSGGWFPMRGNEQGSGADLSVTDTNDYSEAFYRTRVSRP